MTEHNQLLHVITLVIVSCGSWFAFLCLFIATSQRTAAAVAVIQMMVLLEACLNELERSQILRVLPNLLLE